MTIWVLIHLLIMSGDSLTAQSSSAFRLTKRIDTYIYRSSPVQGLDTSKIKIKNFYYSPSCCFSTASNGFIVEGSLAYFFSPTGEIVKVTPAVSKKGRPGQLAYAVWCSFINSQDEFGALDFSERLNLWDTQGELTKSLIIPWFLLRTVYSAYLDDTTLIFGGLDSSAGTLCPTVKFIDNNRPTKNIKTIHLSSYLYKVALSNNAVSFFRFNLTKLSSGQVACNTSVHESIYLVSENGGVTSTEIMPPHFRSLSDVDSSDDNRFFDSTGYMNETGKRWLSSWSYSNPIYEYTCKRLIVPRILYPKVYLDVYSYSENRIDYLGFALTEKPFLFSDTSGIYLLEENNDTSLVVGKYFLLESQSLDTGQNWWNTGIASMNPENLRKIFPLKDSLSEVKTTPRYSSNLDSLTLLSPRGSDYLLLDSLAPRKNHVIFFAQPQDCYLNIGFNQGLTYVRDSANFDICVVLTHPYPSELESFVTFASDYWNVPIFMNTSKSRISQILKYTPSFVLVSKEGKIVSDAYYPAFTPHPR